MTRRFDRDDFGYYLHQMECCSVLRRPAWTMNRGSSVSCSTRENGSGQCPVFLLRLRVCGVIINEFPFISRVGSGSGVNLLQTSVVALMIVIGIGLVRFQLATDELEKRLGIGGVRVFCAAIIPGCFVLSARCYRR